MRTRFLLLAILVAVLPHDVRADGVARLYSKEGSVEFRLVNEASWKSAETGADFPDHAIVRTGEESRAALLMADGVMVRLNEFSVFEFGKNDARDTFTVEEGSAHFLSRKPASFPQIKTKFVTASIRGTEFTVSSSAAESRIAVLQGSVFAENSFGSAEVRDRESVSVKPGEPPVKTLLANPIDAVQWALHYPAIVEIDDLPEFVADASRANPDALRALRAGELSEARSAFDGKDSVSATGRALAAFKGGDVGAAAKELDSAPEPPSVSRQLFRAALYLSRGQVEKATALQQRAEAALSAAPSDARRRLEELLRAQQAIIELVQNRPRSAVNIADRYLAASDSPTSAVTRSYIYQSGFDLEKALEVVEASIVRYPENGFLRARRAELLLAFGRSKDALDESIRAAELVPADPYPQSIKGFASLARFETDEAEEAFTKAVSLSDGSGLAYLGLGLTTMRRGDVAEARTLMQQAAHLEPSVSLFRSYLGKALFEQEEEDLAAEEYARAIGLDPNDPTPYLYRAYFNVSRNQPVSALRDIEQSMALNDNRAVYRSRLLLDQDRSVRSGSLAGVYQTLGFFELARIEAIKSVNKDYSNYSAHQLLATSYDTTELINASISEAQVARLLSPVSFNLARPSQGGTVTGNEYTAVFDRDQNRIGIQTIARTNDKTALPGVVVSGTSGRTGYALTHDSQYTDGYRDNDRLVEHNTYASIQHQVTADDTLLLDATTDFVDSGDTNVQYDPNVNDPDTKQKLDDYVIRAGINHRFGPGHQIIGQVLANDSNLRSTDSSFDRFVIEQQFAGEERLDDRFLAGRAAERAAYRSRGVRGDLQHIYNSPLLSLVTGVGVLDNSQHLRDRGDTTFDDGELPDMVFASRAENTEASRRAYNYTTFHLAPWLDVQGGLTYSHLRLSAAPLSVPVTEETETKTNFAPKAGFVVSLPTDTTIRGAFFEGVGNSGVRELEVIEPTTVGGFNQLFFEPFPGSRSRNLALGVNQKFGSETFVGAEILDRHVLRRQPLTFDVLATDIETGENVGSGTITGGDADDHRDDDSVKGYLYQVITDRITATGDYSMLRSKTTLDDAITRTHRLKVGLNYFDPSGFFLFSNSTYREQRLKGFDDSFGDIENGTRDFWILDAGVGYRFRKRHGQITLAGTNLFDRDYRYVPSATDPLVFPGIGARLQFSYNFEP